MFYNYYGQPTIGGFIVVGTIGIVVAVIIKVIIEMNKNR